MGEYMFVAIDKHREIENLMFAQVCEMDGSLALIISSVIYLVYISK